MLSSESVPQVKKRKLDNGASNDDSSHRVSDHQPAQITSRILANKHISQNVHDVVKKESEQLAGMVVSLLNILRAQRVTFFPSQDELKLWVTLTMPK